MVLEWVGEDKRLPIALPHFVLSAEMSLMFFSWKEKSWLPPFPLVCPTSLLYPPPKHHPMNIIL